MACVLFWVMRQPGGDAAVRLIGLAQALPAVAAAAICASLTAPRFQAALFGRVGWVALGLGAFAFAAAQAAGTYDRLVAHWPAAFPNFSDCAYLAVYPCLFLGFLALALERGSASR